MNVRAEVRNDPERRTISLTLSGMVDEAMLSAFVEQYRALTDSYADAPHVIVADMRGMHPLSPRGAEILKAAIEYGRKHGVSACVHVSSPGVVRLQARRVAREATTETPVFEVSSLVEAEQVLAARRSVA